MAGMRTPLFTLIVLALLPQSVGAGPVEEQALEALLNQGDYAQAMELVRTRDPQDTLATLRLWAQRNLAPAMWMLSDSYHRLNEPDDSAHWVYTALLTTRMDSSLCSSVRVNEIEKNLVSAFSESVTAARRDPRVVTDSIRFAVSFQSNRVPNASDPGWTCRLLKDASQPVLLLAGRAEWGRRRAQALLQFQQDAGMVPKPDCSNHALCGPSSTPAAPQQ